MLQQLNQELVPTEVKSADIISAIVVAVDQIKVFCRQLKYIKNIYLLTNARHKPISDTSSDIDAIRSELLSSNINLKVIGIDFDDEVAGLTEPAPKDPVKAANEEKLRQLVSGMPQPGSIFANAQEAIDTLQLPTAKRVRPVRAFACKLTLGDPTTYQNVLSFDIESFPCVREASAPSASTYAVGSTNPDNLTSVNPGLQEVKRVTEYFYTQEEGDTKEVTVDPAEILPGYKFGAEIVVLSEEEQKVLTTDQENEQAGMQVIGFVKQSGIKRYSLLGNTNFVVGSKGSLEDSLAVGSLAATLAQEQSAAIVRYVTKDAAPVQMGALFPHQVLAEEEGDEPRGWVLVLVSLPFDQDVRRYRFPPLLNRSAMAGSRAMSEQTQKLLVPTEEMDDAMEQFIEDHDLMAADEGGYEYASPDQVFNPLIHRIKHVVKYCALHDATDVIPPILPALTKYLDQPPAQKRKRHGKFDELLGTTPVPPKKPATTKVVDDAAGGDANSKGKKATPRKALDESINLDNLLSGANAVSATDRVQIKQEPSADIPGVAPEDEAISSDDLGHDHNHNEQLLRITFAKLTANEGSAAAAPIVAANMVKIVKREPARLRGLALELVTTAFAAGEIPDPAVDAMADLLQTLETLQATIAGKKKKRVY
ncbi:hypothetical protein DV113_000778 [Geotrichum candidum]|nr:hypothetical protein DV452_000922 [Geotrichum candidum]KAF7501206.1 hypothetical protein DV113_000778 [Geotrichum candidum]KAI8136129.1 hypothetical protein DUD61_000285 [Geotrichum candidum]KAI9214916.1 hypothetical protein DS838_000247 [Geotrichum bryndzae]